MNYYAEFLLARIAEDEAVARAARPNEHLATRDDYRLKVGNPSGYMHVAATSTHVLAECEAKRAIVERYQKIQGRTQDGDLDERLTLGWVLEQMAAPYADHPDYREEWRL